MPFIKRRRLSRKARQQVATDKACLIRYRLEKAPTVKGVDFIVRHNASVVFLIAADPQHQAQWAKSLLYRTCQRQMTAARKDRIDRALEVLEVSGTGLDPEHHDVFLIARR